MGMRIRHTVPFHAIKFEPVEEKPDTPSLVSPNHGATNISRTTQLDWSYVSGVTYRVQVSRYSSFSSKIINTTTSSSYYNVPSGNLNYETKYYWRVRSEQNNQYSDYQSRYFTTENAPCYSPQSDFSGSPRTGVAPLSVSCSDNSSAGSGSIESWSWNFGDGGSSTSRNPSHSYNSSGTYTVKRAWLNL